VGGLLGLLANAGTVALTAAISWRVFAFTFLLAVVTGTVFGLAPAWQATAPSLAGILKDQTGSVSTGRGHVRLRKVLVVSQVALSLLMLIGATLFTRSLYNLQNVNLGFQREGLLSFSVDPSLNGYAPGRILQFAEDLQTRVSAVRGIRSAAIGENPVISDNVNMSTIQVQGYQAREDENMNPYFDAVSPGYFATMGIPLMMGREFTERDRLGTPGVAIVNDVFARYYFKNESAIGKRFGRRRDGPAALEIVGVVKSSKYSRVDEEIPRVVYLPVLQNPNPSYLAVYARAQGDPKALFPAIRRVVRELDANLPVTDLRTMDEQVGQALAAQRLMATLSGCFAVLATLLAAIGLYGVMAYSVTRRSREIGIRVALGAGRGSLLGLVMREAALLTACGVVVAIPAALALTRLVRAQLYQVVPYDPLSVAVSTVALTAVALLAGYIPAERATRVNPILALRHE
jgi:predicted permease